MHPLGQWYGFRDFVEDKSVHIRVDAAIRPGNEVREEMKEERAGEEGR